MDQVGRLDQTIELLAKTSTPGTMGGVASVSWDPIRTLYAEEMSPASRARYFAMAETSGNRVAFRVHYNQTITHAHRIAHNGKTYHIRSIAHTGRVWTRIDCEEVTRGT